MPREFHKHIEKHIEPIHRVYRPVGKMMWHNFLGGISWSIGATIGLVFIVGLITFLLGQFVNVPIVGERIADIIEATNRALQNR